MTTVVRAVESGDEAQWRVLFDAYIEFYQETVPQNVIDLTWRRLIAGEDGMAGLVALNETGRVVGIANLIFHRSTWAANCYCYLEDLYADVNVRGQGVGRALVEATYKLADERGADRTYWATQETNATARKLYGRVGVLTPFVQYRRRGSED